MLRSSNIFTVDVEEWYHANYESVGGFLSPTAPTSIEENLGTILDMCDRHRATGTFFVLGSVAEAKPHVVEMIARRGHEVASHGYGHQLVYQLSPEAFEDDVCRSRDILSSITGRVVLGYRAPSWSVTERTAWIYPILRRLGFRYDASVFPVKTFLYGIPTAPRFAYQTTETNGLVEMPTSTIKLGGKNVPFSGGFYLRALPTFLINAGIRWINREGHPAIVYIHPREIDRHQPRLNLPFKESLIHYVGIQSAQRKLNEILASHRFASMATYLDQAGY